MSTNLERLDALRDCAALLADLLSSNMLPLTQREDVETQLARVQDLVEPVVEPPVSSFFVFGDYFRSVDSPDGFHIDVSTSDYFDTEEDAVAAGQEWLEATAPAEGLSDGECVIVAEVIPRARIDLARRAESSPCRPQD